MEAGRQAVLLDLKGSLLLSGDSRPAKGFRADAVILTGLSKRLTWLKLGQAVRRLRRRPLRRRREI